MNSLKLKQSFAQAGSRTSVDKLNFLPCEGTGAHSALKIMGRVEVYYLVEGIGLIPETVLLDLNQCGVVLVILLSNVFMPVHPLLLLYTTKGAILTSLVLFAMDHLIETPLVLVLKKSHIYVMKFSSKQCL